jgi:hypothetical protein
MRGARERLDAAAKALVFPVPEDESEIPTEPGGSVFRVRFQAG